jgi:cytochrome c553
MRRRALVLAAFLAGSLPALPASSQVLGLADDQRGELSPGADSNRGRFLAMGGFHGELRVSCVQCHDLDGTGNSSGAFPRITDQSAWYLYKTLQDYAAGLRPSDVMGPIARMLSSQQMQDLAAYYASVQDAPYPPRSDADVEVLQIGGTIAAAGIATQGVPACNGCHGPNGIGQPPIYPYLAGQYAPYTEHQLMLWKQGRRDGDPMNIMELIAKAMTPEQIRAVSLYFESVRPREVTPVETRPMSAPSARPGVSGGHRDRAPTGAVREAEPGRSGVVVPGTAGASGPQRIPPYLTQPQPTRSGPNMTTTGQRPDPTR